MQDSGAMIQLGYKASAKQFGPKKLLEFAVLSEELGLGWP
jgi:hypothetical protein